MRNIKKLLSVLLVVSMLASIMVPALAAETEASFKYEQEAKALYELGLFAGKSTTEYQPALDESLTRQEAVILLLKLFGEDKEAEALTVNQVVSILGPKFSDALSIATWASKYVAYAVKKGYVSGYPDGTFKPTKVVSGEEYCTLILKRLGFEGGTDFKFGDPVKGAAMILAKANGLSDAEAKEYAGKAELTRDDFVGISFGILSAEYKGTTDTVIKKLVETSAIPQEKIDKVISEMPEVAARIIAALESSGEEDGDGSDIDEDVDGSGTNVTASPKVTVSPSATPTPDHTPTPTQTPTPTSTPTPTPVIVSVYGVSAVNGSITVKLNAPATALIGDFKVNRSINSALAEVVTPTAISGSGVDYILTVPNIAAISTAQSVVYTVAYKDTAALSAAAFTINSNIFSVDSVSATNLHQVVVVFSEEVDKTSAERTSNYTGISGATVRSALLQPSEKTVILNLYKDTVNTAVLAQATEYSLVVENVKSKDLTKTVTKATKTFTANDASIPTVISATALGNKGIRIVFSEPVKGTEAETAGNYSFIGETIDMTGTTVTLDKYADPKTTDETYTIATITLGSAALTPGDHKIRVNGTGSIKDFAGFAVVPQDFTISLVVDTVPPTVASVVVNSRTEVTVNFSEAVQNFTTLSDVFWNTSGSATMNTGNVATTITKVNDSKYTVDFSTYPMSIGTAYVIVKNTNVKDFSNNLMAANVSTQVAVAAQSAPIVTAVNVYNDKTFYVYFDKSVKNDGGSGSATYASNYTFKNSAGTTLTNSDNSSIDGNGHPTVAVTYDSVEKKATISLGNYALSGGNYKLQVSGVQDPLSQVMSTQSVDISVTDTTSPTISSISYTTKTVVVTFSEAMATSGVRSLTDASNYRYAGDTLPAGTTLEAINSNKAVRITLSDTGNNTFTSSTRFQIGYISGTSMYTLSDLSGNLFTPVAATATLSDLGATAASNTQISFVDVTPTIKSATQIKIEVPADKAAFNGNTLSVSDFIFSINGTLGDSDDFTGTAIELDTADNTNHTLLITIPSSRNFNSSTTLYLFSPASADAINTKDVYSTKILHNVSKQMSLSSNKIKPMLTSASVLSSGREILITFDGFLNTGDSNTLVAIPKCISVVQGTTYTGTSFSGASSSPDNLTASKNIKLTLASGSASFNMGEPLIVKTVSQDLLNEVLAYNGGGSVNIAANTAGITVNPVLAAVSLSLYNSDANSVATAVYAGDGFDITFNRVVDPVSIKSGLANNSSTEIPGLITVDVTNNKFTFAGGTSIGSISTNGIISTSGSYITNVAGTINYVSATRTLQVRFSSDLTGIVIPTGTIEGGTPVIWEYTPDSAIKSTSSTPIDTTFKPMATGDTGEF